MVCRCSALKGLNCEDRRTGRRQEFYIKFLLENLPCLQSWKQILYV